jgi:penicillin-insensitive murein endopeptidase
VLERLAGLVLLLALGAGCPAIGAVNDGSSLALGPLNRGKLVNGVRLPAKGDGWRIPPVWSHRGNNFGTEELVGLVVRAARRVAAESPGSVLNVADLAAESGGKTPWHRTHQTGLDVDFHFFALDDKGQPAPIPRDMYRYGADGWTLPHRSAPRWQFDLERNWLLARAILEDPLVEVQYIFVSDVLKHMLLDHARAKGEPIGLIERATVLLHQPEGALPHDDHFHVRIYCPPSDRGLGCEDIGPLRWTKKGRKYVGREVNLATLLPNELAALVVRSFCVVFSVGVGRPHVASSP